MELTQEQKNIIKTDDDLTVNAVAGSGKTSTIIEYARRRPEEKILYLAFNRTVKLQAEQLFAKHQMDHITVETAHSLAYRHIVPSSPYVIRNIYRPSELVTLLNIPIDTQQNHLKIAWHVWHYYLYFCNHTSPTVAECNYLQNIGDISAREFVKRHLDAIIHFTRILLSKMNDASIEITHDFYLKKFQLLRPILPYTIIFFDEGQDASPVMLDVFVNQPARRIIIGDSHQSIYGWRHAVDALEHADFQSLTLSRSFRFGADIARLARNTLSLKSLFMPAPDVRVIGNGVHQSICNRAYIARTNASLIAKAIELSVDGNSVKAPYFEGKISSYLYTAAGISLHDLIHLNQGSRANITNPLARSMPDLDELKSYASETGDQTLKSLISLVKRYGNSLQQQLAQLQQLAENTGLPEKADMIFTNVHKSKGLEYDEVFLANDFVTEQQLLDQMPALRSGLTTHQILSEEVNMLYVAITRTKTRLHIPATLLPTGIDAGQSTGFTTNTTCQPLKSRHGNGVENLAWSRVEDVELRHLFGSGKPIKQIAFLLNRNTQAIQHRIEKLGLWQKL